MMHVLMRCWLPKKIFIGLSFLPVFLLLSAPQRVAAEETGRMYEYSAGSAGAELYKQASDIVFESLNMIGIRYRFGGNTPKTGLDCSGFVRYVYQHTVGMTLPRRAEEMSRVGKSVNSGDLHPGDLVFFNTMRRTFSHVGIYIGDNHFIHAPSTGHTIRIDNLANRYWRRHYTGARRISLP